MQKLLIDLINMENRWKAFQELYHIYCPFLKDTTLLQAIEHINRFGDDPRTTLENYIDSFFADESNDETLSDFNLSTFDLNPPVFHKTKAKLSEAYPELNPHQLIYWTTRILVFSDNDENCQISFDSIEEPRQITLTIRPCYGS